MSKKMRAIALIAVALNVMSTPLWVTQVAAREPGAGNNYVPGLLLGIPTGANPPPGLPLTTFVNYYFGDAVDANGNNLGNSVSTAAVAPRLAWVPKWTFLGASYMAFVVQPIVSIDLNNTSNAAIAKRGPFDDGRARQYRCGRQSTCRGVSATTGSPRSGSYSTVLTEPIPRP